MPGATIELDVERFQAALATAANLTDSQAIPLLRQAVACYTGELLPGGYDEWIFAEREALHTQCGQQARQHLEASMAAYDRQQYAIHIARYGQDPGVVCLSRLAWTMWIN